MKRLLSVVLVALGTTICHAQEDLSVSGDELQNKLESLVPEGWTVYEGPSEFNPDNLYEQINGRAIYYLSYDCTGMTFLGIENEEDAGQFLDVSVFDMGYNENAYGVYSSQRPSGFAALNHGRESYDDGGHRYIWDGRYYTIIVASDTTAAVQSVAEHFAAGLSEFLPDNGERLPGLEMLPESNRIPKSDKFFRESALGLDFLNEAYFADYTFEDGVLQMFVSKQTSTEAAQHVLIDFATFANAYVDTADRQTVDSLPIVVADMGETYDVFLARDSVVMGAFGAVTSEQAIRAATWLAEQVTVE